MKTTNKINMLRALTFTALISSAIVISSVQAEVPNEAISQPGDPVRWYQEEMTPMAYFKTLKKEAEAVYQLSVMDCKRMQGNQGRQCLRDAKDVLQQDIAAAYQKSGIKAR